MNEKTDNKTIYDVFFDYEKEKSKILKPIDLNECSIHIRVLTEYLTNTDKDTKMSVIEFTQEYAENFMNYIETERNVSNMHYNKVLNFYKALFKWMIFYNYISVNPFEKISHKSNKPQEK
ncbi:MAG: hypothetical protein GY756_11735 [bacterium]|nr:hypothetical protein [bacterium]